MTRISAAVVVNEKEGYDPSKQERIGAEQAPRLPKAKVLRLKTAPALPR